MTIKTLIKLIDSGNDWTLDDLRDILYEIEQQVRDHRNKGKIYYLYWDNDLEEFAIQDTYYKFSPPAYDFIYLMEWDTLEIDNDIDLYNDEEIDTIIMEDLEIILDNLYKGVDI